MTKDRIKKDYNVNVDNVIFFESENGMFSYSKKAKTSDGHFIIKEGDDYTVVCGNTNTVSKWRKNLHQLEE